MHHQKLTAKAGMRQYMRVNAPSVAATQRQIKSAGNAKAQFNAYCAKFPRNEEVAEATTTETQDSLIERLAALITGAREVGVQVVQDEPKAPRTRASKPKASTFSIGTTFLYHGKSADSVWEIVAEGKTKANKPGFVSVNTESGRSAVWNTKSLNLYLASGQIEV